MRFASGWFVMCALLAVGCGNASCPEGFVEVDGICTLPIDATVTRDAGRDAAPSEDALVSPDVRAELDAFVPRDAGSDAPLPDAFLAIDGCTPSTFYVDADGDGYGNAALSILSCDATVVGYTSDATDCDDDCMTCRPGGTETCDGRDNDCAGGVDDGVLTTFYADCDGDMATVTGAMTVMACARPASGPAACSGGSWVTSPSAMPDCDDACGVCYPGNSETCDDRDNDCDVTIDEGVRTTFVADCDSDTFTAMGAQSIAACTAPAGTPSSCGGGGVWRAGGSSSVDCNDSCASCYPGDTEICDGLDQDCVMGVDNGVLLTFYRDCDGDGFTPSSPMTTMACTLPSTRPPGCASGAWLATASVGTNLDCWDSDARARPGQLMTYATSSSGRPSAVDFDFDCDTVEERRWTTTGGTCPAGTTTGVCGVTGWAGATAPACGVSASYVECRTNMFLGMTGHYTCVGTTAPMPQECN